MTDGLQRLDLELEPQRHAIEPKDVLGHIRAVSKPGIYALLDFHPYLEDPVNTRLLKDIALDGRISGTVVLLVSHRIDLPSELTGFSARFEMRMPSADERRDIVLKLATEHQQSAPGRRVEVDRKALELLVQNLSGLSHADVERLARAAIVDDDAVTHSDVETVMQAKYELLNRSGVLSFEYQTALFGEVAGFGNVKRWLIQRRSAFGAEGGGLDTPKGILLLGVQGCGKSLAAKAAASALGIPLLRLDIGALYNKYHGETERNLRQALATADVLSPCALWLDEIEKGVAVNGGDSGTSQRVLGTLLTWMAERRSRVFLVATANDIQALPPELIRKGRFDEIFFVDLPNDQQRAAIFDIHLKKRSLDPQRFEIPRLVAASRGFSGAEIEQAVVAARYAAQAERREASVEHVIGELKRTRPLSIVMAEHVASLRAWAKSRTVPAD
ncbi:MAG: AAA family ATPase [Gammaproteobacteria bacterium]|nr:AAA family ATPase [Gammaproteobacteria bacterium]